MDTGKCVVKQGVMRTWGKCDFLFDIINGFRVMWRDIKG